MPHFTVILPAAGSSTRFGADKLSAELSGRSVIARTVEAFVHRDDVSEIVIATNNRQGLEQAVALQHPKLHWCEGGPTRAHTVLNAARAAAGEWLAIHDAARPLVSQPLIDRVFAAALQYGAAAPALPVHLTIKQAHGPLPAPIQRTVPRHDLFAMQTPQCMRRDNLIRAFDACPTPLEQITDDVQLLELLGLPVTLVEGEPTNLKLTTPLDLRLAGLLCDDA